MPVSLARWRPKLLALAWRLRALPDLAPASASDLLPLADRWRELAKAAFNRAGFTSPAGMTTEAVRSAFALAWTAALCRLGTLPIDQLVAEAKATPIPDGVADRLEYHQLRTLCRLLQRHAEARGQSSFALGLDVVVERLGVPQSTASRYLARLAREGVLTLLRRGDRKTGLASEYRFVGASEAAERGPPADYDWDWDCRPMEPAGTEADMRRAA